MKQVGTTCGSGWLKISRKVGRDKGDGRYKRKKKVYAFA
jgi:hypothetical protein